MKRQFKALTGILCASAMALTGLAAATSASAAEETTDIVIERVVQSDQFEAFRLLNATYDATTFTYTYTLNPTYTDFLLEAAGKTPSDYADEVDGGGVVTKTADEQKLDDIIAAFKTPTTTLSNYLNAVFTKILTADVAADVVDESVTPKADGLASGHIVSDNEESTTGYAYKFSNVPMGYYLVNQTKGTDAQYELIGADTTIENGELRIEPKKSTVQFTKKVKDYNTSTGEMSDWQDSADLSRNAYAVTWSSLNRSTAHVPFRLQAVLPDDVDSFDLYQLIFHDTVGNGFYASSEYVPIWNLKVYIGDIADENLVEGWTLESENGIEVTGITFANGQWKYTNINGNKTFNPEVTNSDDPADSILSEGDSFAIGFKDLSQAYYANRYTDSVIDDANTSATTGIHTEIVENNDGDNVQRSYTPVTLRSGMTVTVLYDSAPCQAARQYDGIRGNGAVHGSLGNSNVAYVEYSVQDETNGILTTANSVSDTVRVFTYGLDVEKTDEAGNAKSGARFTLMQFTANDENRERTRPTGTFADSDMILKGESLTGKTHDDVKAPADGWWVTVDNGSSRLVTCTDEDGEKTTSEEDMAHCVASFRVLGDGLYKLVETTAPDGYSAADPILFWITADHDVLSDDPQLNELVATSKTATLTAMTNEDGYTGIFALTVANYPDTKLPSTGGMGTVLFYTIGGLVILVAVAGLAYSMKKHQEA